MNPADYILAAKKIPHFLFSRPAFLIYGAVVGAFLLNWIREEMADPAGTVFIARATKRITVDRYVEVPVVVKVPVISKKTEKAIEKDYGFGVFVPRDGDTTFWPDNERIVTDEKEVKDVPEGSTVTAATTIQKSGETESVIKVEVPRFSWTQKFGGAIGVHSEGDFTDRTIQGYGLWEPLYFPRWGLHLRATFGADDLTNFSDTKRASLVLERR